MIDRLGLGTHLAKSRPNVPTYVPLALFGALVHHLNTASNKKSDYTDTFVILTGIVVTAQTLRVHTRFQQFCALLLPNANLLVSLKSSLSVRSILALQNIPEALRK